MVPSHCRMKALISCIPFMVLCILSACNSTRTTSEPGPVVLEQRRSLRQQSLESTNPLPRMKAIEQRVVEFATGSVTIQAYAPGGSDLPVILLLPSIDFTAGDLVTHNRIARSLAVETPAVVVLAALPHQPEATVEFTDEAAFAILDWIPERISRWGGTPDCITLIAEGAGARNVLGLARTSTARGGPVIAGLVLPTPTLQPGDSADAFGQLPSTYILLGADDPSLDQGTGLAKALAASGSPVRSRTQGGLGPLRLDWALVNTNVNETVLEVAREVRLFFDACRDAQASATF